MNIDSICATQQFSSQNIRFAFDQFERDFLNAKDNHQYEASLRAYESSNFPEDLSLRLLVLKSIFLQRERNLVVAEEVFNTVLERVQDFQWSGLYGEQLEKIGDSLHRFSNDIAYRAGFEQYEKFINLIEESLPDCAGKFLILGNYQFNQCQLDEGIESCKKAMEKATTDGQRVEAINILVASYMFTGEYDRVIEKIEETLSLKLNPNIRVNFLRKLADTYMAKGQLSEARVALESALEVFNEFDNTLLHFTTSVREGILLAREGKYEEALKKFWEVRQLLPNANMGQKSLVIGNVGLLLERMREAGVEAPATILDCLKADIAILDDDLPLAFVQFAYEVQKANPFARLILGSNLVKMCEARDLCGDGYRGKLHGRWVPFSFGWDLL